MSSPAVRPESRVPNEREVLEGLGVRWPIPPFVVRLEPVPTVRTVREGGGGGQSQIDAIVTLSWSGSGERFAVEYKAPGTPRQVEAAIMQLRRYLGASADLRPLVVAPYLKPELLERLAEEGISAVDLSGNMAITVPGRWLVIRSGAPNRFPASATIKNIYRGKSALVCRALMLKGEYPSATAMANELGDAAGVTLPTVSKVLTSLEEELLVVREGGTIRVIQPSRLLDNLVANYRSPVEQRVLRGKVSSPDALRARLQEWASRSAPAYAIDAPERYTIYPSAIQAQRIYTTSLNALMDGVPVDESARFPDVEIVETDDLSVYLGRVLANGTYWASPLQVYLELAKGGKRAEQAAAPIRDDLLAFKFA